MCSKRQTTGSSISAEDKVMSHNRLQVASKVLSECDDRVDVYIYSGTSVGFLLAYVMTGS